MRFYAAISVTTAHGLLYGLLPKVNVDHMVISLSVHLVVVFALSPFFTNWLFTRHIKRIQTFVEELKNGDFTKRLPVTADSLIEMDSSELNQLHQSLNWMARQIDIREQTIRAQLEDTKQREQDLQNMVIRDSMTKLFNRKYFREKVSLALSQLEHHDCPFALAILDIDFFKKINDGYGHLTGDAVILKLARLLEQHVRGEDIVARIGGEEFAVLLTHADQTSAEKVLTRLQAGIRAMEIPLEDGLCLQITVSIGFVAVHTTLPANQDELFHQADMALYHVKQNGRNGLKHWSSDETAMALNNP